MSVSQPSSREKNRFFKENRLFVGQKSLFRPILQRGSVFADLDRRFQSRKPL